MKNFLQILKEQKLARNWYWYRGEANKHELTARPLRKGIFMNDNPNNVRGVYLSTDKDFTINYSYGKGYLYTYRLKLPLNIFNIEFPPDAKKMEEAGIEIPEYFDKTHNFSFLEEEQCLQFVKKEGYDGLFVTEGGILNIIIFDIKKIRPLSVEKLDKDTAEMKILKKPKREPHTFENENEDIKSSYLNLNDEDDW